MTLLNGLVNCIICLFKILMMAAFYCNIYHTGGVLCGSLIHYHVPCFVPDVYM